MSMDPNFPDQTYPPQKQGGSKLFWGLGLGCGLVLLLCCGAGAAALFYFRNMVETSEDPAIVRAAAQSIAQFDLPNGFEPERSVKVRVPFVDVEFTMVMYQAADDAGQAVLAELQGGPQMNDAQVKLQLDQQLDQQGAEQRALSDIESHDLEVQINGEPATFKIEKGKDAQSNTEYIRASGTFKTDAGTGSLLLEGRADKYSEEQIEQTIRSIQ